MLYYNIFALVVESNFCYCSRVHAVYVCRMHGHCRCYCCCATVSSFKFTVELELLVAVRNALIDCRAESTCFTLAWFFGLAMCHSIPFFNGAPCIWCKTHSLRTHSHCGSTCVLLLTSNEIDLNFRILFCFLELF